MRRVLAATLIALAPAAPSLGADEIVLRNGDRLSGEVLEKSGDRLVIRTEYAGEVTVRWSALASIRTERPIRVVLEKGDEPVSGRLHTREGDRIQLVPEKGEVVEVAMKEVRYLNPKPYETAKGVEYRGRAMLSAAHVRGNVRSDRAYGEGELTARARPWRYNITGRAERREEMAGLTASNYLLGASYDRFLTSDEKRFNYVRGSLEHDRFKDIDQRRTIGGGHGLQLLETEQANLSVRGGLDYVALDRLAGTDERYPALGWGVKAAYKPSVWRWRVELFHDHEGFWNLKDTDSVTIRSKTGLRVPLIERLNAVAQYNVDWERRPAPGRRPTDSTLLLGVDYTW
jgi:putative salt-induced outer membrane protein YdiY